MIVLKEHVRFFIPVEPEHGSTIRDHVAAWLSTRFGGATEYRATGSWVSPAGGMVREPVYVVESYGDKIKSQQALFDLAEYVRQALQQEAVAVEINGALYILDGSEENRRV